MSNECYHCPVKQECFYPFKPCDCVHQRKFWSKEEAEEILARTSDDFMRRAISEELAEGKS